MDVDEALRWLADVAQENLGTEIALRTSDGWSRGFARRPDGSLAGVSTHSPGQWFLEAESPAATADLVAQVADDAQRADGWPAKVTTSGAVKHWLRPLLTAHGVAPVREHDLLAMACHKPPGNGEGRWATPTDRPTLEQYQTLYNAERRTTIAPDWDNLLRRRSVAVLERDGRIVAVVKRTADTARYATIGGTWTDPACRGDGLAKRLTAFLVSELLCERPAVHLVVDDDNVAAIALYRTLQFEPSGSCYMGYLQAYASTGRFR